MRWLLLCTVLACSWVSSQGQAFTSECPTETPVFPSSTKATIPAGHFERHDPLFQTQLQQFALDFAVDDGCICTQDIPMEVVYTELPDFLRVNQLFNDTICLIACNKVMPALGSGLPNSNRFITPATRDVGLFTVSQVVLRFLNVPITTETPNLQFYIKGVDLNVANLLVFRARINTIENASGIIYEEELIVSGVDSTQPCETSNNWTKVTIHLGGLFDSPTFLELGGSTADQTLTFQMFGINYEEANIGLDNFEFVGPPYNGTYTPPTFNISDITISFPFSLIGETPADAFFTVLAYIYMVVVLGCLCIFQFYATDRTFQLQKVVVYSWVSVLTKTCISFSLPPLLTSTWSDSCLQYSPLQNT